MKNTPHPTANQHTPQSGFILKPEEPREQRRHGETRQKIRQFDLADFENYHRHDAGDETRCGIDGIDQAMFVQAVGIQKRRGIKPARERDSAQENENRKGRQRGQRKIFTKLVIASASMTAFTASSQK